MTAVPFDLARARLDEGTVWLEASAGTGKTYTLTGILLRLLLEEEIECIEQALVVTFTIAATDELKNRLRAGITRALAVCEGGADDDPFFSGLSPHGKKGARILRQALDDFDRASIATIHGFCKRLLDESAFESHEPFELEFAADEGPLWDRAAEDALRLVRRHDGPALGALLLVSKTTPDTVVRLYRRWQRYPDVLLDPAEPQVAKRLATLASALQAAAAVCDDAAAARAAGLAWLDKAQKFVAKTDWPRFGALVRTRPDLALDALCCLAPSHLEREKWVSRRNPARADDPFLAACEKVLAAHDEALAHLRSELLLHMHARLAVHKQHDRLLTFQDLLSRTHEALHDPQRSPALLTAVRARYRVGLIDEFQDTDSLQYGIFAACFRNSPLFLVGDPKQSIYGFRGADPETYLEARNDAVRKETLSRNFRSSPQLVDAVSLLFGSEHAFVRTEIGAPPVRARAKPHELQLDGDPGAAFRWRFVPPGPDVLWPAEVSEPRIAADVTAEISRLLRAGIRLDDRPLRPRDIAVLTRLNRQASMVQDNLRAAGIVSAIGKAGDVFETEELVEIELLMQAMLRPTDLQRARAAMATRIWGLDAAQVQSLESDEPAFEDERGRLETWHQLWHRHGFVVMKEQMLADVQTQSRLLEISGGERRLTNCQQLFEMLHEAEHTHRLSPEGLLQWLQHERRHKEDIDYQRRELRLESDEDAVQILTVHGSKGLEYEVVFCPFLWGGRTADRDETVLTTDDGRQLTFDAATTNPAWLHSEGERLAEDVRLCYVALTRAKRRCYVHWGAVGSNNGGCWRSALGWLLRPAAPDRKLPGWQLSWGRACKDDVPEFARQLQELIARSKGTMDFDEVDVNPRPEPVVPQRLPTTRPARVPVRKPPPLLLHSFTSLVAGALPGETAPEIADPPASREPGPAGRGIFGFQRGAEAGQCLHDVLEHVDLDALDGDAAKQLVTTTLQQFGLLEQARHPGFVEPVADVLDNLRALAEARVHATGPTMRELCRAGRAAEWQFMLPAQGGDLHDLAAILREHGSPVARAYADRLETLKNHRLRGFLGGFADLVARHEDRFWIVDWKSNHLGASAADYGRDALLAAMHQHDYVLQYHLYSLAVHRHLRVRLPGYDPERHLGGICYAFLRGAVAGSDNGMFFDRPPTALLDAMDRWAGTDRGGRA